MIHVLIAVEIKVRTIGLCQNRRPGCTGPECLDVICVDILVVIEVAGKGGVGRNWLGRQGLRITDELTVGKVSVNP